MTPEDSFRHYESRIATLESELAQLRSEVEALKVDAERYRWLRENINIGSGANGMDEWRIILPDPGIGLDTDKVFDAAIDAARKESANEK
mgnify:CR=1 FL=1